MSVPWASGKHVQEKYTCIPPKTKLHFYTVKVGWVYIGIPFFLFLIQNTDCGYSLQQPRGLMVSVMDMLAYAVKQKESIQCSWL